MDDFKDFWNQQEGVPVLLPESSSSSPSIAATTRVGLISSVAGVVAASPLFIPGGLDRQAEIERFSNEVSSYATSDAVISQLSQTVGKPTVDESEEEFVDRASNLLREILRKHFNL